jgi:Poxvirus Late Transcription Factor VLTF3 like
MTKSYDLSHIHELVQHFISSKLQEFPILQKKAIETYWVLVLNKQPYGVTIPQKRVISVFEQENKTVLKDRPLISLTKMTLKEYKEKISFLDKWNQIDSKIVLFYPLFLSQFESIMKDFKQTLQTPLLRSFSQKDQPILDKKSSPCHKELDDYLYLMNDCFDKSTVDHILDQATPKETKLKVQFEDNVSVRAKRYLESMAADCDDDDDDDDDTSKSKVFSGVHFTDLSRVNINQTYKYEKKCHFRDTVKQYQGLQNKFIPEKVFTDVISEIKYNGIYDDVSKDPYRKLTKDHIRLFLDETGHAKYYEDLQLIYSKITGRPCPNISKYERKLYDDFDCLVDAFLSLEINRKNFLNSHYVLRQLLKRQGVRVGDDDLSSLKTLSRVQSHDEIYQRCCELLNWNFTPV